MVRLAELPESMRSHLVSLPCPTFNDHPRVTSPSLARRRVAIISMAGLHRRSDRPFEGMAGDYRVIRRPSLTAGSGKRVWPAKYSGLSEIPAWPPMMNNSG